MKSVPFRGGTAPAPFPQQSQTGLQAQGEDVVRDFLTKVGLRIEKKVLSLGDLETGNIIDGIKDARWKNQLSLCIQFCCLVPEHLSLPEWQKFDLNRSR